MHPFVISNIPFFENRAKIYLFIVITLFISNYFLQILREILNIYKADNYRLIYYPQLSASSTYQQII